MTNTTRFAIASLLCALPVSAHFIFVLPDNDKSSVKVIINETLEPGGVGLELVPKAHLMSRASGGSDQELTLTKSGDYYTATLPGQGTRLISGIADLGVMKRGEGKPNLLIYYPKAIAGDAYATNLSTGSIVELSPIGKSGATRLRFTNKGQPIPDSEITVLLPDGKQTKVKTDAAGLTPEMPQTGRFGAWARLWEPIAGEKMASTMTKSEITQRWFSMPRRKCPSRRDSRGFRKAHRLSEPLPMAAGCTFTAATFFPHTSTPPPPYPDASPG